MAVRMPFRLSGRVRALRSVCTAIMPQPMSTPTAAGIIAPFVGITLPTVAPIPQWTSGMAATHSKNKRKLRDVQKLLARLILELDAFGPGLDGRAIRSRQDVVFFFVRHESNLHPLSCDGAQ